jgi:hypothetical protein
MAVAVVIGLVGLAAIADVPYERWRFHQSRRDLERALTPFARVPIRELAPDRDRTIEFRVQTDAQWRRILRRMGDPAILVVVATDPDVGGHEAYSAAAAELTCRATQRGQPLPMTVTKSLPYVYSSSKDQLAYSFRAVPDETVQIAVRAQPDTVPSKAFLLIFPHWNGLEMWDWADGLGMAEGLFTMMFAPMLVAIGATLIFVAVGVGWRAARLSPKQTP